MKVMSAGQKQLARPLGGGPLNCGPTCGLDYQQTLTADCSWSPQLTLAAAAAAPPSCDVLDDDAPADAESCCGEPTEQMHNRLAKLAEADCGMVEAQCQDMPWAATQQQPQQQWQQQRHWPQRQQQQYSGSRGGCSSGGHSSGGCCSSGTAHMGDDFECMASEDVSMLLEDTAEYPGGVEAALADWAGACSSQLHAASCTAGAAVTPLLQLQQQAAQQAREQQQTHGVTTPSLTPLLMCLTPAPDLATSLLPCCRWGAFEEEDPVGDVLAGKAPVPGTSCCSSGGLTDCLMGRWT